MPLWLTAKQIRQKLGVTSQTLYNWRLANRIQFKPINQRTFMYDLDSVLPTTVESTNQSRLILAYARVSNTKQRDDLLRQETIIQEYAANNGIKIDKVYSEIASGMNENRKQFNSLIDLVIEGKVQTIYVTYRDRLTRFGFTYFESLFSKFNCAIIALNTTNELTFEQELTQDLISIIHHFSMKMYSNRRSQLKKIARELENENN